ncbi:putative regulatory protein cys-3 [Erysiphe neolycopersici]|uniref:Putative regulatory protein cys-3 n=1 Tax=Erysiphe neolycopersici TaxID=212602 RepID=A0A420HNA4_9PEZI|nr:putative regulatory protein cys-3 [Erysiphe neolycopersici]
MSYSNRSSDILEYIANLNRIPSESDSNSSGIDQFNIDNNLAMFSNTQYFDFELSDLQQSGFTPAADPNISAQEFSFSDFESIPKIFEPQDKGSDSIDASVNTSVDQYPSSSSPTSRIDSFDTQGKVLCVKSLSSCTDINDISRHSAEEDKRRRNTAASARFRIKKKQREQALERNAKEMSDKISKLEGHIKMLETENKWLKDLITDKNNHWMRETQTKLSSHLKQLKEGKITESKWSGVNTKVKS